MITPIFEHAKYYINNDFDAHYTQYKNNTNFTRAHKYWTKMYLNENERNPFVEYRFVEPQSNDTISTIYSNGVPFACVEHVSICIGGNALHTLSRPDNSIFQTTASFGDHTTEHGTGYIPIYEWTRHFTNNYKTCCLIPKPTRNFNVRYHIEVVHLAQNQEHTMSHNSAFAHVAYGTVSYTGGLFGEFYHQTNTIMNLTQGQRIFAASEAIIAIVKIF